MNNMIGTIPHLEEIKVIRKFEEKVFMETNVSVYDISHWNSGFEYKKNILTQYKTYNSLDFSDYHYSYEYPIEIKQQLMSQLTGIPENKNGCVIIHNATAAICCIADYLKKHDYKKICIIEPAYFSIYSCLVAFGLDVHKETVILDEQDEIILPYNQIIQNEYDAVWITSPIFSTGIYFSQPQIDYMNSLLRKGVLLIIDESASSPKYSLTRHLYPSENIISIFSPHKYIAINSVKFAAIICNHTVRAYIEDWIDVFVGSLSISTCMAIEHYLSSNFTTCLNVHDEYIQNNIQIITELCNLFPDNYCKGTASNYITIHNKSLPYVNSLAEIDMFQIMKHTHVSFIPGYINGFSKEWGFCYRVNLTQDSTMLKNCIGRLFNYFS